MTKKGAKKKCDDLWRKLALMKYGAKCEYCGKQEGLNVHHIYSRSNNSTRHDIENACVLCISHHCFSSSFSAHKTPADFIDWIKDKRGKEWYATLRVRAQTALTHVDYALMALWLEKQIEEASRGL